jgi:hypothetical protein
MQDRRAHRSDLPHEAGRLFFQAVLARHGLDALVLTNEDGLLVLGAERPGLRWGAPAPQTIGTSELALDWIAAVGCVCAIPGRRGASLGSLVERVTGGRHLDAAEIPVRGERLYLVSVGGRVPAGPEVRAGIERILARSLPAAA